MKGYNSTFVEACVGLRSLDSQLPKAPGCAPSTDVLRVGDYDAIRGTINVSDPYKSTLTDYDFKIFNHCLFFL